MLSPEENELLTRIEGDAPAGRMMRRYWFPALLAEEVADADGTPVRLRMFGQNLVAFRDTSGALGIVDAACPHRLASLALGRNEEGGLRCIYHGWKFNVRGQCVEMPTEPEGFGFAARTTIRSYPVREAGGLVWTYLGPPELEPPFPAYDWTTLPREQLATFKIVEQANYLQVVEGGLDSAHTLYLHRGFDDQNFSQEELARRSVSTDLSPRFEAEDTAYGIRFAMIRKPNADPERTQYVKITAFAFPSTCIFGRPISATSPTSVQIFVPIDDRHTMHYTILFSLNGRPLDQTAVRSELRVQPGVHLDDAFLPHANESNGWQQDRALMKRGDWTGIAGFPMQDVACQESMGAIADRTREHLGTSDVPIIRFRRRLIDSIARVEAGQPPVGLDVAVPYERLKTEQRVIGIDEPWQQVGAFAGEFVPS